MLKSNLEKDPAVIFALDPELRIVDCNEAWDRFAAENGGQGLDRAHLMGRSVLDAAPEPLKQLLQEGYRQALVSHQPWEYCYECSSPTMYRTFRMVVYPDPDGTDLLVVNSLTVEKRHDRQVCFPEEILHVDQDGVVTMCCNCRRTRRVKQKAVWDWVPSYVEAPPTLISHGICAVCLELLYSRKPTH
jgi:hypothetical protein